MRIPNKPKGELKLSRRRLLEKTFVSGAAMAGAKFWGVGSLIAQGAQSPVIADPRFSAPVLDPVKIPKFVDALPTPDPAGWPLVNQDAVSQTIKIVQTKVNVLPAASYPNTTVWCYRGVNATTNTTQIYSNTFLGPTFVVKSGTALEVTYDYSEIPPDNGAYVHLLRRGAPNQASSVIDKHIHGTMASEPEARFVAHLHGANPVDQKSDGYSEAWVTPTGRKDPGAPSAVLPDSAGPGKMKHTYPNKHPASLTWYHDHSLGITRLNVYAGGAGGLLVTDSEEQAHITQGYLPDLGTPLIIQDRMFYADGSLAYPDLGATAAKLVAAVGCTTWPASDVSTRPEFFGDVVIVNGKSWPYMDVQPGVYRFRFLNGCNSRVLDLSLSPSLDVSIIGTEAGFLPRASVVRNNLVIGPAERFDVLIDFTPAAGKTVTLKNKGAKKPYPGGTPPNPQSDALVMQFRVAQQATKVKPAVATPVAWTKRPKIGMPTATRKVLLVEGLDEYGRIKPMLGEFDPSSTTTASVKLWSDTPGVPATQSKVGRVEMWEVYNTTADTHPMHLHEATFRVDSRQAITFTLPPPSCAVARPQVTGLALKGLSQPGELYEEGFKDTALCPPGMVTRLAVDFTSSLPGLYVWHCHILEHEDHEMMLPFELQ